MRGAIIGDIIGSRFEFDHDFKSKDFELFHDDCKFTDDTAMTCAVADWIMSRADLGALPAQMRSRYIEHGRHRSYGVMFEKWLNSEDHKPSFESGAATRISPILLAHTGKLDKTFRMVESITAVSHKHQEGIRGAVAVAGCILLAHHSAPTPTLREFTRRCGYTLDKNVDEIRKEYSFDETCQGTVPQAIICALEATDFEDAIRNAVSIGGDSDTIAAITGSIAEQVFKLPEEGGLWTKAKEYLPPSILKAVKKYDSYSFEVGFAYSRPEEGPSEIDEIMNWVDSWRHSLWRYPDGMRANVNEAKNEKHQISKVLIGTRTAQQDGQPENNSWARRAEQARRSGAYQSLKERRDRSPDLTAWHEIMSGDLAVSTDPEDDDTSK